MRRTHYINHNERPFTKYLNAQYQTKKINQSSYLTNPNFDDLERGSYFYNNTVGESTNKIKLDKHGPLLNTSLIDEYRRNPYRNIVFEFANKHQDMKVNKPNSKPSENLRPETARNSQRNYISEQKNHKNSSLNQKMSRGSSFKQELHNINKHLEVNTQSLRYDDNRIKTARPHSQNRASLSQQKPKNQIKKRFIELILKNSHQDKEKGKPNKVPEFRKEHQFFQYVLRFSYRSRKGYTPNKPSKVNQDAYIITPNINKKSYQHFFGICDGHGQYGHHVSSYIKQQLPHILSESKDLQNNPKLQLMKIFKYTAQKLKNNSMVDLNFSGSTAVGCYFLHNKIYCCNVGDSRAIIGRKNSQSRKWTSKLLSNDHKPSDPSEAQRIIKSKGRIQAYSDNEGNPIGPLRVWIQNDNIPGLAMTRSFGDFVAASVGVSNEPEIIEHTLSQEDKIILIASDGVWQFLESSHIIEKLSPFYEENKIEQASDFLLELSSNCWMKECQQIDDISFILIFMNYE